MVAFDTSTYSVPTVKRTALMPGGLKSTRGGGNMIM